MAVVTVEAIVSRIFRGSDDPRFPTGIWYGNINTVGDASGGDNTAQFSFNVIAGARNAQQYSLEQVSLSTTIQVSAPAINLINWDLQSDASYMANVRATQDANKFVIDPNDVGALRGIFLGAQRIVGIAQDINVVFENINTEVARAILQGYIWGPRSLNAPGGPQRPPNGLFPI